jgi:hypothetical protein
MEITLKELVAAIGGQEKKPHPYQLGKNYLIRTVTMIQAGRLVAVYDSELVLEDASWIADTGRFSKSLVSCDFKEVEMFNYPVIVNRSSIIDATLIDTLPTQTK